MVGEGWGNKDNAGRLPGKLLPQSRPKMVKVCTIMGIVRRIRIFIFWIDLEDKANRNAEELCIERERENRLPC